MKLRYFTAAMTEIVAGTVVAAGMWLWSRADLLEIIFMVLLGAPLAGAAVLVVTDPEEHMEDLIRWAGKRDGNTNKEKHDGRKAA